MILDRIRTEKEARGWSNQRLADESGVPIGTVNRIIAGKTDNPYYSSVVLLCRALELSIDEIEGLRPASDPSSDPALDLSPEEKKNKYNLSDIHILFNHVSNSKLAEENEQLKRWLGMLITGFAVFAMFLLGVLADVFNWIPQ